MEGELKGTLFAALSTLVLGGCAESHLSKAETPQALSAISPSSVHTDVTSLLGANEKAARMAYSYIQAAKQVATIQDATTGIVILSAAATAYGAATGAGSTAIAQRALPGVLAGIVGGRYASKRTIQAIYAGAKRLNCISAKAGIAGYSGAFAGTRLEAAAVVATRSAMLDAQIITRSDVIRDSRTFKEIMDEIGSNLTGKTASLDRLTASEKSVLTAYVAELNTCVQWAPPTSPSQPTRNSDIPSDAGTSTDELRQG